jgi:endonuclease III
MNYLVDPDNITNFEMSAPEMELNILFWVCAAGKKAKTAASNLCKLLNHGSVLFDKQNPFEIILSFADDLPLSLKNHGIGCYNNKSKTMLSLAKSGIDLSSCSVIDLEKIPGIGAKTSRCYVLHSRRGARYAGLDTHCLKYLRERGYDVPKSTPTGKKYRELEEIFLKLVDESGKSVAQFDLEIWRMYSSKKVVSHAS